MKTCRHALTLSALLLGLLGLCLPGRAAAQSCEITSSPNIDMGSVTASGGTSSGSLDFLCRNPNPSPRTFTVCLFMNDITPTGVAPRRMINWDTTPQALLNFDLYTSSAYSQLIGSESSGHRPVHAVSVRVEGAGQSNGYNPVVRGELPIHARVPAGQTVGSGNYVSQITPRLHYAHHPGNNAPSLDECIAGPAVQHYTEVRANFANACAIAIATDLEFGSVDALEGATHDQTSTIQLQCPTGTVWRVGLDNGRNASGTTRRMSRFEGDGFVLYELYRDSARSQRWGNTLGTDTSNGVGTNGMQSLTVYGRVPPQETPAVGDYSDTVTVTLTY